MDKLYRITYSLSKNFKRIKIIEFDVIHKTEKSYKLADGRLIKDRELHDPKPNSRIVETIDTIYLGCWSTEERLEEMKFAIVDASQKRWKEIRDTFTDLENQYYSFIELDNIKIERDGKISN